MAHGIPPARLQDPLVRLLVYMQPEHVGAGIVPGHVEVELAFRDLAGVGVRDEYAFALVERSRENPPQRADDQAAALDPFRLGRSIGFHVLACRQNETTS